MTRPEDLIEGLTSAQLADLAVTLVELIAPYGVLAPGVIEPMQFRAFRTRLTSSEPGEGADEIAVACEDIIARFVDAEPEAGAFFAFGAVVAVYYACGALRGDPTGGLNAAKRFLDLAGAADDDGVAGVFDLAVECVATRGDEVCREMAARIAAHAASLR